MAKIGLIFSTSLDVPCIHRKNNFMMKKYLAPLILLLAVPLALAIAGCGSSINDPSTDHPDTTGARLGGMKTFSLSTPMGDSSNLMTGNLTYTQAALHAIQGELEAKGYMYQSAASADFMISVTWEYGLAQGVQPAAAASSGSKTAVLENVSISIAARNTSTHTLLWLSPPVPTVPRNSLTGTTAADMARQAVKNFPAYTPYKA
jgi:hypothetical protein